MPRSTDVAVDTCLRLLLVLSAGLLCNAIYESCERTDYFSQLSQRRTDIAIRNEVYDDYITCCSSSWVVDAKKGTLGVYFRPIHPANEVKVLILQKWESGTWSSYTEVQLLPGDYETVCAEALINTSCFVRGTEKYGYHTFEHISNGSYRIYSCPTQSAVRNIVTDFDESTLNCSYNYSAFPGEWFQNGTFIAKISYQNWLEQKSDVVYTLLNSSPDGAVLNKWVIQARKKEDDHLTCEKENDFFEVKYISVPDTKTHQQKFSINGLKRGFYYVKVTILGALSIGDTRINVCSDVHLLKINGTDWPSNLDSSNHDSSNHESNPVLNRNDNLLVIFVIGLAAVGVISSFCYVIFRIRKYYLHHDERRPGETMPKKDLARKKVLLLYARDCPQFSDLMATFRELLKKNNFEVYDFYDPAHSRQVDENPTLWMKCLVKDSSVRVVVVSTKCAYLQQLTLTSGGFFYKKPHHLDHLFLYGLCDTMSVHTNIYQKIYSVAWEGFTQKEDTLSVLSDSRIYSLPTHLFELLRDLRHNTQTPEETAELRWQATILQEKLDILIRYTSAEKDYLRSIILTD